MLATPDLPYRAVFFNLFEVADPKMTSKSLAEPKLLSKNFAEPKLLKSNK
jgi:hypothetical protein